MLAFLSVAVSIKLTKFRASPSKPDYRQNKNLRTLQVRKLSSNGAPVGDVWKFPNKVNSLITLYTNFYILEDIIDK